MTDYKSVSKKDTVIGVRPHIEMCFPLGPGYTGNCAKK